MSLLFAEYLIEQNLLNADQVVEAMLVRLKNQPSTSELVYELGVFSNSNFLKILVNQQITSSDFIVSAKNLGLWNQEIEDKLIKKIKNLEPRLGDILIQKGYIDFEKISSAFNSFIEGKNFTASINQNKNEKKSVTSVKEVIHPQMLKEYFDCFDGAIYTNVQNRLSEIDSATILPENLKILLKKIEKEFVTCKAASEFIKAEKSLDICKYIIKFIQKNIDKISKEDIEKMKNMINTSLNILNFYRKSLSKSQNELDLNDENTEIIKQFLIKINDKE